MRTVFYILAAVNTDKYSSVLGLQYPVYGSCRRTEPDRMPGSAVRQNWMKYHRWNEYGCRMSLRTVSCGRAWRRPGHMNGILCKRSISGVVRIFMGPPFLYFDLLNTSPSSGTRAHLSFTGWDFTFQILSQYSPMDLSEENLPIRAT